MKKTILGFSLLAVSLTGTAIAQSPSARPGAMSDSMGDKTVTKAEAQARVGEMFTKMDANKDGKLDTADRDAHKAQKRGQMFEKLDGNKDGAVSRDEFAATRQHHEAGAAGEGRMGKRGGRGGRHGGGHGDKAGGMMLKMADTNQDGAVSRDEFIAAHAKMFDTADANKDGKLTADERKAHHAKMRTAMGGKRGPGGHGGHAEHGDMPPPPPAN